MPIDVVPYSARWRVEFDLVAGDLRTALVGVCSATVEHVGSTSVPGLASKPVLDIDVVVDESDVPAAVAALESVGYVHRGDLGVTGREAFIAPDDEPRRHVYVCQAGTLNVRNHLAVRDVLRSRDDLRTSTPPSSSRWHRPRKWTSTPTSRASQQCSRRCSRSRTSPTRSAADWR